MKTARRVLLLSLACVLLVPCPTMGQVEVDEILSLGSYDLDALRSVLDSAVVRDHIEQGFRYGPATSLRFRCLNPGSSMLRVYQGEILFQGSTQGYFVDFRYYSDATGATPQMPPDLAIASARVIPLLVNPTSSGGQAVFQNLVSFEFFIDVLDRASTPLNRALASGNVIWITSSCDGLPSIAVARFFVLDRRTHVKKLALTVRAPYLGSTQFGSLVIN